MTTKAKAAPVLNEIVINYSVGMKANIGNYESANASVSKTEKWDVSQLTQEEADAFFSERYEALQSELGEIIVGKYEAMLNGEI